MKSTIRIKTIRPIDPAAVDHDPYLSVASAAQLTGLGKKAIRNLPLRKFGTAHFVAVTDVNDYIRNGKVEK